MTVSDKVKGRKFVYRCPKHGVIESSEVECNPIAKCPICGAWLTSNYQ